MTIGHSYPSDICCDISRYPEIKLLNLLPGLIFNMICRSRHETAEYNALAQVIDKPLIPSYNSLNSFHRWIMYFCGTLPGNAVPAINSLIPADYSTFPDRKQHTEE